MYADPHTLLALADGLRTRGHAVRRLAATVGRDTAAVEWHGRSAEAMRSATRLGRRRLLELADQHDRVAEQLTDHAHRVAARLGVAAGVLRWLEHVA